jgi:hypothetical protein
MEWLKKNFLQISIKSQINFGVITVSVCVCVLVFVLLGINVFILLNMSYTEILQIIDSKETQQIDSTSLYVDFKVSLTSDSRKIGIQWIRNILENLNRNKDFVSSFQSTGIKSYIRQYVEAGYPDCNNLLNRKCLIYNSYGIFNQAEF